MFSRVTLVAVSVLWIAAPPRALAQLDHPLTQRLPATAPAPGDNFGAAVAMSADTLAIGAVGQGSGAVHIYDRVGAAWVFATTLSVPGLDPDAEFGAALDVQGDRLVVGAPRHRLGMTHRAGVAFVFDRIAGVWSLAAQLDVGVSASDTLFGSSVDVDGDRIVIGAPYAAASPSLYSGAAYVFERSASTWLLTALLGPSDAWHSYEFGASVRVVANTIVVGAPERQPIGASSRQGAVYVYALTGVGWQETQILTDTLPLAEYRIYEAGRSLAFDGQTIVAGSGRAQLDDLSAQGALVFENSGTGWSAVQRLNSSTTMYAGVSVALEGDTVVVGAQNNFANLASSSGAASIWKRQPSGWTERWRLTDSPPLAYAHFGNAVAITNGRIAVGSRSTQWNVAQPDAGAACTFDLPTSFGELLCFGDGSGTNCPCNKNTYTARGPGCENSIGRGALLIGAGSPSVSANDLTLTALQLIPGKTAVLVHRANSANGGLGVPLHNGLLCIAGSGGRLGTRTPTVWPWTATWGPQLASQIGAVSGGSAFFQVWYRDPTAICGNGSNLTNAFKVTFSP